MSLSRRSFVRTVGVGSAGMLSSAFIIGRGSEARAFETELVQQAGEADVIKISSNENARGPGAKTMEALRRAVTYRVGRGYSPDHVADLVTTIAGRYGANEEQVTIGTGSGGLLQAGVRAFCSRSKPLVTVAPTYGTPAQTAQQMGVEIKTVPVDGSLSLDLDAMTAAATGAGLVFFCNPNNPTGTVHTADAVDGFVRQVKRDSPDTAILIDEAYFDYVWAAGARTAAPLALELPGVFITRSLSKAHGMAGLRVGYAIGQPDTVRELGRAWNLGSMNTLSAAAGIASLEDPAHIDDERAENAQIRDFTTAAFRDLGFEVGDSHTNHIFVNLRRPARVFREACLLHGVRVGRDFPPMEQTHSRISLGTMEEMETAVAVFRRVLEEASNSAAG